MADQPKEKDKSTAADKDRPFWDCGPGTPALPGGPCLTPPHPDWSGNEIWAWEKICVGEAADFNQRYGVRLDPRSPQGWYENRKLSSRFLETILLHEPWRSAVPRNGVVIRGAWLPELVDLSLAKVAVVLGLISCRFEAAAEFIKFITPVSFSLRGSYIGNHLALSGAEIGGDLFMQAGRFGSACLIGTKVSGQLGLDDASFGLAAMHDSKIGQVLAMKNAEFSGDLALERTEIGGALIMEGGRFGKTSLLGAKIGGQLTMSDAQFSEDLTLQGVIAGDALFMRGEKTVFQKSVKVIFSEVGTILDISGAEFHSLLDLTGTKVDSILCGQGDKPPQLKLDRFTYNHLGGLGWEAQKGERMTDWDAAWFVKWLARQKEFSPQPYEQCAKVLRESGQPGKANDVLYACKEEERERAKGWRRVALEILKWTIGYGYYYRRLLNWGIPLLYLGAVVASSTDQKWAHSMWRCFGYSLDMLLPVIRLAEDHYQTVLSGWQRYYFFAHQIAGYALATVALVGLTGLTERKH